MAEEILEISFAPNSNEEQLLGGTPEPKVEINKEVITDSQVAQCSCTARTLLVEHGTYKGSKACLLGFKFTFHSYLTRYKHAKIDIEFTSTSDEPENQEFKIVLLYPQEIVGQLSEEKVKKALSGQVTIGYDPYASATVNTSEEKEGVLKHYMSIKGSVIGTNEVRWTLEENTQQKNGIPLQFIGYIIVVYPGPFQAELDIDATIGRYQATIGAVGGMVDYIRRLLSKERGPRSNRVAFDSQTPVDRREDLTKSSFKIVGWTQGA
jgi:hypothetical protein